MAIQWDQDKFNRALREYLARIRREKIPNALNKKAYFLARRAVTITPKKDRAEIVKDVGRIIIAKRKDGTTGPLPMAWAIIAKRAAKEWPEINLNRNNGRIRSISSRRVWLSLLRKKLKLMLGARSRAAGFMRLGWWSTVMLLAPHVKNKSGAPYMDKPSKLTGRLKGRIKLARQYAHHVTIENLAHAVREKRGGFVRIGAKALDQAFREETTDMILYLENEALKEETARFNAANSH